MDMYKNAYLNARDCLVYGYGMNFWNDCGIPESDRLKVWNKAKNDLLKEW